MCLPVANCPGAALTNDERDTLTNAHNLIRSQIALGSAPNWAGNLNAGKNIYMLKYDCALEEAAKNAMGGVCSQAIGSSPYGHNVQAYVTPLTVALPKAAQLQDAVQQWYAPVRQYGLSSVDNRFTDSRLQSFANLAHYQTTAFGCHYAKCNPPDRVVIGCMYNHPYVSFLLNANRAAKRLRFLLQNPAKRSNLPEGLSLHDGRRLHTLQSVNLQPSTTAMHDNSSKPSQSHYSQSCYTYSIS
ncbi:hypothetical protein Y032_0007g3501 [Ancylostoma ceylanicum]|uniref:SCP domain-containing protein n=1 Tax=Ancylostoma ceylanicum TaxID=53326 RepID=A0A016VQ77_9BILA|nr:hypothetical protein Y032_0007g3501 [Ancylostoma ceylanicum]